MSEDPNQNIVAKTEKELEPNRPLEENSLQELRGFFQVERSYQGPLPHPDLLKKFDEVKPGLASEIIEDSKEERRHRHRWENKALYNNIIMQSGGLLLGWIAVIVCIAAYFVLTWYNFPLEKTAPLLGLPLLTTIMTMMRSSKPEKNNYKNIISNEN